MPSWRHYHSIAFVPGTILHTIDCVYLQGPRANPSVVELNASQIKQWHILYPMTSVACASSTASAKNISVRAEWLRQSGRAPSEPSETPRWRFTPYPASRPRVASHIALRSPFRHFFSLCRSPILNKHSGVVANCDHTSEWVHWVHTCNRIAMQWVTLWKSLLAFVLH